MKKGFKSKAEKLSVGLRETLKLKPSDFLDGNILARYFNIRILPISTFPPELLQMLNNVEDCGWSALTLKNIKGEDLIIHNDFQSIQRQQSNIMHELAHIICEHKPVDLSKYDSIPFDIRHFNPEEEEEAEYLGSALQIPRSGLVYHMRGKKTELEISDNYNASLQMVTYRINICGFRGDYNKIHSLSL